MNGKTTRREVASGIRAGIPARTATRRRERSTSAASEVASARTALSRTGPATITNAIARGPSSHAATSVKAVGPAPSASDGQTAAASPQRAGRPGASRAGAPQGAAEPRVDSLLLRERQLEPTRARARGKPVAPKRRECGFLVAVDDRLDAARVVGDRVALGVLEQLPLDRLVLVLGHDEELVDPERLRSLVDGHEAGRSTVDLGDEDGVALEDL